MPPTYEEVVAGAKMAASALFFVYQHVKGLQKDRVRLEAKISPHISSSLIEQLGCPGLEVTVISRGDRPAKLESVFLEAVVSPAVIEGLERGFGFSFGQSKNPDLPPARLLVDLYRVQEADENGDRELSRDDAAKFIFPIAFKGMPAILSAPSESVRIGARLRDGNILYLQQGLNIQEMIRELLEASSGMPLTLKKTLKMTISVSAEEIPNVADKINTTNAEPIRFGEPLLANPVCNTKAEKCISIAETVWGHWATQNTNDLHIEASREFELTDIDAASLTNFTLMVGETRIDLTLIELLNVIDLLRTRYLANQEAEPESTTLEIEVHFRDAYPYSEVTELLSKLPIRFLPQS